MRILAAIGALAIIVAVGAAAFFFGGFYSVAGTAEDPGDRHVGRWSRCAPLRSNAMRKDQPPANFNDPAKIQAGARAFAEQGCANCHGAPGVNWAKYSEGLHPDPPDLKEVVNDRTPATIVLGDQERHQHDRHAELPTRRREGRGHLVDCGVLEEAADRFGSRLQGLDRPARPCRRSCCACAPPAPESSSQPAPQQ